MEYLEIKTRQDICTYMDEQGISKAYPDNYYRTFKQILHDLKKSRRRIKHTLK
jgi:hypothetical protein